MGLLREQLVLINKAISGRDIAFIASADLRVNRVAVRAMVIGLAHNLLRDPCRHLLRQSWEPREWSAPEVP